MANINANDDWAAGVYQYADGDVLDGGPNSTEVLPFKQLAGRSIYQRLRGVTPWDASLANQYGYPQFACVFHNGFSWRSKVATSVEPGTDPDKWERWGFTLAELETEFGGTQEAVLYVPQGLTPPQKKQARTNIGAMGYFGAAEALPTANEGGIWKEGVGLMVWNGAAYEELFLTALVANNNNGWAIATGTTVVCTYNVPRTGKLDIFGVTRAISSASGPFRFHAFLQHNGVKVAASDELTTDNGSVSLEGYSMGTQLLSRPVIAGDVITLATWRHSTSIGATHSGSHLQVRYIG